MMAWISPLSSVEVQTLEDLAALDLDVKVLDLQQIVSHRLFTP